MINAKKIIVFSAAGLILLLLLMFFLNKSEPKHTEAKTITLENENVLQDVEEANLKIRSFVLTKVPFDDVFLKFELPDSSIHESSSAEHTDDEHSHEENIHEEHSHDGHSHSSSFPVELLKEEVTNTFYSAIINNNVDQLTMALTTESLYSLWEEADNDFEEREKLASEYLKELYRNGDLQKMTYSLKKGSFDSVMNEGVFNLQYQDGTALEIPFKFVEMGEGHHEMLQLELIFSENE